MIICHIVGISNKIKESFINTITNISDNIFILDMDDISKKIIFAKDFSLLYDKYLHNNEKRVILKQLGNIWKNNFIKEINKNLENYNSKYIILIGLITFFLDQRIKIDIDHLDNKLEHKFFVSINNDIYVKQLIEYNIDTYKNDIINGKFPLTYLDFDFLKEQRILIQNIYSNKNYKSKTYDVILNWIKHKINSLETKTQRVWVASFNRYENNLEFNKKNMFGYDDKWLALISIFPKKLIKRGLTFNKDGEKIPVITELIPNAFNEFNKPCYVYEFIADSSTDSKLDSYRYKINNNMFVNKYYISNIKNELELNGAIFDKFKFQLTES